MFFFNELPSPSSIFSTYASMAGYIMLVRSMVHDMIPRPVQDFVVSSLRSLFGSQSSVLTLTIDCDAMGMNNDIYDAAQDYLSTKISPEASTLRITKGPKDKHVNVYLSNGEIVTDLYQGIELKWRFVTNGADKKGDSEDNIKEYFELTFDKKHRELVLSSYIEHVLSKAKEIEDERRILKMYTLNCLRWECVNLEHPSTFETMAMDDELKRVVMDDLDRFIRRRDFYKRVGKAWKRGYLLYGPPGTGKSSLVAAMANYLKFDVYDLQLGGVMRDSDLRRLLLGTHNRSILVIEDIDCAVDLPNRLQAKDGHNRVDLQGQLTLSGLLNFIDGLWSSCGDERIIIFTTNHKEKLDPALLRPGRMDMHIYMGHCSFQGFKTLASNYLGLPYSDDGHRLYNEIERMMGTTKVTPAQIAEELMKSEDADVALEGLIKILERKSLGGDDESEKTDDEDKSKIQEKTKCDTPSPTKSKGGRIKKLVFCFGANYFEK